MGCSDRAIDDQRGHRQPAANRTGRDPAVLPVALREKFRDSRITLETMTTGAAVRTYNILMGEGRPVSALLIAVD